MDVAGSFEKNNGICKGSMHFNGQDQSGFLPVWGDNCRAQHHQPQADGSNRGILDECMLTTLFLV